jgi:hypothetical protein
MLLSDQELSFLLSSWSCTSKAKANHACTLSASWLFLCMPLLAIHPLALAVARSNRHSEEQDAQLEHFY